MVKSQPFLARAFFVSPFFHVLLLYDTTSRSNAQPKQAWTDIESVELCRFVASDASTEEAFKELYRRYATRIRAYCFRIVASNEAEDVFQETFVKFYNALRDGAQIDNVAAYILRIARNLCLNHKRDNARADISLDAISEAEYLHSQALVAPSDSERWERLEYLDVLRKSVELLPHEYREAFVLREYEQLSYEEMAKLMQTSVANAKVRVFRAKQQLKEMLMPYIKDISSST
jgi:RNA polymerase sigma-70 factor (ECF subfamily)